MLKGNTKVNLMIKLAAAATVVMCTSIIPSPFAAMAEDRGIENYDCKVTTGQAVSILDKEESNFNNTESEGSNDNSEYDLEADKTELIELYNSNKGKIQGSYTDESWSSFRKAMINAKKIIKNDKASQDEVDNAEYELQEAIWALTEDEKVQVDKTELKKLYNSNKNRTKGSYAEESWEAFVEALNYAGDIVNDINATQHDVNTAKSQLQEAIINLKEDVQFINMKNELEGLYNINKNKIQGNYSDESWMVFRNALKNANDILHKDNASIDDLKNAQIRLEAAVLCLSKNNSSIVDKTGLNNLYNANKNKTQGNYTSSSWEAFRTALNNAGDILNNMNVSQEEVNNAVAELEKAAADLKENNTSGIVDKKELTELFNENRSKAKGNYTNESWNKFIAALSNASTNIYKPDVTQESADNAKSQLEAAIAGLKENDLSNVDKSDLQNLYNKYRGKSKGDYSDDSWGKFMAALSNANSVINNSNAAQDDVKNAMSRLEAAVDGLKKGSSSSTDKSYLRSLYDDNKNKCKGNYTDSSWSSFTSALSNASYVLNNSNASQSEIDNAESRLDSAIDGLRKKSDSADSGDKTSLQNLYNENKSRTKGNNSDSSWSAFSLALNYAYSVINNSNTSSSEISTAESRLRSAVSNLTDRNSTSSSGTYGGSGGGSSNYGESSNSYYSSNGYSAYNTNNYSNSGYTSQYNGSVNNNSVLNDAIKKISNNSSYNQIKRKESVITHNGKKYEVNVVDSKNNNEVKVLKSDCDDRVTINAVSDADVYVFVSQLDKYMKIKAEKNNVSMAFDTVQDSVYAVSKDMSGDNIVNSGWNKNDGWYYISDNGKAKTGWFKDNDIWYKSDSQGLMETGWSKDGDKWYYLDSQSGAMQTGWQLLNGTWYYLQDGGAMETGWVSVNDKWYYMNSDGSMKTGWFKDTNNNWYYLKSNGEMAKNETIDGFYVNENGAWA